MEKDLLQLSNDGKTLEKVLRKNVNHIAIPNSVTKIGEWAFCGCNSLESIKIPNSVAEIGDRAFSGCTSLLYGLTITFRNFAA